jgi:hypothetical protein
MAAAAVARAFDPAAQELDAEMKQRVMSLRYTGDMMAHRWWRRIPCGRWPTPWKNR